MQQIAPAIADLLSGCTNSSTSDTHQLLSLLAASLAAALDDHDLDRLVALLATRLSEAD
ncbi:MAG: hypothetical protein WD049_07655 [Candidatus Paceibacterota bacterium]